MSAPPSESPLPRLPRVPRGRSTAWAGMALLVVIELTVMSCLVVSYFYLRVNTAFWPPPGVDLPDLVLPAVETGVLLALLVPAWLAERAWKRGHAHRLRWLLPGTMGLCVAALFLKGWELAALTYSWQSHAYGSMVWTLHCYSALHVGVLLLVLLVLWLLVLRGKLEREHGSAVEAVSLYTTFVGASSLLTFATASLAPHLL